MSLSRLTETPIQALVRMSSSRDSFLQPLALCITDCYDALDRASRLSPHSEMLSVMAQTEPWIDDVPGQGHRTPMRTWRRADHATPTDVSTPSAAPSGKRRRLTLKSSPPSWYVEAVPAAALPLSQVGSDPLLDVEGEADDVEEDSWEEPLDRQAFKRLQTRFHKMYTRWSRKRAEAVAPDGPEYARAMRRFSLKRFTWDGRLKLVRRCIKEMEMPEDVVQWAEAFFTRHVEEGQKKRNAVFFDGRSVLLTCQGEWGVRDKFDLAMLDFDSDQDEWDLGVQRLSEVLREDSRVQRIHGFIIELEKDVQSRLDVTDLAWSLELCTETLHVEHTVRLHMHLFLRSSGRIKVEHASQLRFLGSDPHRSDLVMGASRPTRGGNGNAGLYYIQCPKKGMVLSGGTVMPFRDYLVSGEWVMNLVQGKKMTYECARQEMVKSAKNLCRLLPCLDRWHLETRRLAMRSTMTSVQESLAANRAPFKSIDVVNEWIQSHECIAMRYKFLVLVGGSGLGKTQFAKGLVPDGAALELNMAAAPEPDLREYDPKRHRLVLFDECEPKQVMRQKKLFQCPPAEVQLGASATNCHAYKVWVHQKLFVICSNVWCHEVQRMFQDDASWLAANSVVYHVTAPLWQA